MLDTESAKVTIAYFDPALPYSRRQEISQYSYGFSCSCAACKHSASLGTITLPPTDEAGRKQLEERLTNFALPGFTIEWPEHQLLFSLPADLSSVLHEDYLPSLSSTFRNASHDGPFETALRSGLALLALYMIVYPPRYPPSGITNFILSYITSLTEEKGLHCLELAKVLWNGTINGDVTESVGNNIRQFLRLATESLDALRTDADEGGPYAEIRALWSLLQDF